MGAQDAAMAPVPACATGWCDYCEERCPTAWLIPAYFLGRVLLVCPACYEVEPMRPANEEPIIDRENRLREEAEDSDADGRMDL